MRTTLDLPEALLREAMESIQSRSKTETIIHALRELLRRQKREAIKQLAGKIELQIDVPRSRRRPR